MLDVGPLEALRRQRPLIHCVSNLVTANDCANLALAVGASPMMACAPQEMAPRTRSALRFAGSAAVRPSAWDIRWCWTR